MQRCLACMEEYNDAYDMCPHCGYENDTPPKEAYHMVPGIMLNDRYIVGRVLGFGGFGVTYIGFDTVLERKVAIKEYLPGEFATRIPGSTQVITYAGERTEQFQSGLTKFLDEAKMLAKVQVANGVVQIFNSFMENETAYIVMEYLEGQTLSALLKEKEKLSVEEAKEILHPIILALKEIHELGIIHRDIAPDNIFLTTDGRVKLLDFGASRFATTSYSKSLSVIIKQGYAPVEQYRSRGDQGPWTDVYSLAATFYKMITGVTPTDAMDRVEKEDLKKPSKLGVDIAKNEENAIMNAMNLRIEDRTQNVEILEKELYHEDKVKLRFIKLKKADVGAWPLWAKITAGLAALGVCVFAGLLLTGVIDFKRFMPSAFQMEEGMTRVPNLINEEVKTAESLMTEAELILQIVDKQYSEYIPVDLVLSQKIEKGQIVGINNVVETVISGGREPVFITNVCGMYQADAINELFNLGFVIEVEEEYSSYAQGVVFEQSIPAKTQAHRGDVVILKVSLGYDGYVDVEQEVTIPDFSGMTLEEATEEAGRNGLQVVRKGTKKGSGIPGTVMEQAPVAGEIGHQGDLIELYLIEEDSIIRMPDVQYKDESAVVKELESMGLKVKVNYEQSSTVAKGKIISQNVKAYTELKSGDSVTLVVSEGTPEINEIVNATPPPSATAAPKAWSNWVDILPSNVTMASHEVQSKKQYSFRDKSTITSSAPTMDGWIQYNSTTAKGDYGAWSNWSTEAPAQSGDRDIQSKVQYSYSDYETIQSETANLSGWNLINTETYYLDDYGGWSDWTENGASASDTRKIETKAQYRFRTRSWTTQVDNGYLDGWTQAGSSASYGGWSDWSETPIAASATVEVQTEQRVRQVQTGTKYRYYQYKYWGPDYGLKASWYYTYAKRGTYYSKETTEPLPPGNVYDGHQAYGGLWWLESTTPIYGDQVYTVYRSRSVTTTYSFYQWGGWSDWSDTPLGTDDNTEVATRTLYRYADRVPHYKYTYDRWTNYTAFGDEPVTESATRNVKQQTIYRYRDKQDVITYYFYRWGDWSDYRDEAISATDTREVRERNVFRYR